MIFNGLFIRLRSLRQATTINDAPADTPSIRATVLLLLAMIAPLALELPWMPLLFACVILTAKGIWPRFHLKKGHGLLLFVCASLAMWLVHQSFGQLLGRDSGVAWLAGMAALKAHEIRRRRDQQVLEGMALFLLFCHWLYWQDLGHTLLVLGLLGLWLAIVLKRQQGGAWQFKDRGLFTSAGLMLGTALPLAIVLFIGFPRIPGPLFQFPQNKPQAISGLSDTLRPGSISSMLKSDKVAFRVTFYRKKPVDGHLYWRAMVLNTFDGDAWRIGENSPIPKPKITNGEAVDYEVILEPNHRNLLLAIEFPTWIDRDYQVLSDQTWHSTNPIDERIRYRVRSLINALIGQELTETERQKSLNLPVDGNLKTRSMSDLWHKSNLKPEEIVNKALEYYEKNQFAYTLNPPSLGKDMIDDFLFKTHAGFCEHYASSFVFMMRAAGVPARVVVGYQGGESNPLSNYLIVRQADAHAWAEVWLEGQGWVRVDPTAVSSPTRIEAGIAAALAAEGEDMPDWLINQGWLYQWRMAWDSTQMAWERTVVAYDNTAQDKLLQEAKNSTHRILWVAAGASLCLGAVLVLFWPTLRQYWQQRPSRMRKLYRKIIENGGACEATMTPMQLAQIHNKDDELIRLCRLYTKLRYTRHGKPTHPWREKKWCWYARQWLARPKAPIKFKDIM